MRTPNPLHPGAPRPDLTDSQRGRTAAVKHRKPPAKHRIAGLPPQPRPATSAVLDGRRPAPLPLRPAYRHPRKQQ